MMTTDTDESGLRLFPVQPVLQDDRVPAGLSVSELARSRKVLSPAAAAISRQPSSGQILIQVEFFLRWLIILFH